MWQNKVHIAFDVDGTLIHQIGSLEDTPRYDIIHMLITLVDIGCAVSVWSGGGTHYASRWCEKLGLLDAGIGILPKQKDVADKYGVDITFDDEEITLGKVNIRV